MPVIPAWIVRANFHDPRKIPYLLVWKRERDGEVMEAVRLACQQPFDGSVELNRGATHEYVELKRTNGTITFLRIVWRMLPCNGGRALLLRCPHCETPRRHVYGCEWDSFSGWSNTVRSISWRCRSCARLRYSSEGGHLRGSGRAALAALVRGTFGNLPRPESWFPYVFTSPKEAAELGVCELSSAGWFALPRPLLANGCRHKITSGLSARTLSIASRPSVASPQTSHRESPCKMFLMPVRDTS
jgi:hypothetical protein